jgi:hypothetical protein
MPESGGLLQEVDAKSFKGKGLPSLKAKNFACRIVAQTVAKVHRVAEECIGKSSRILQK